MLYLQYSFSAGGNSILTNAWVKYVIPIFLYPPHLICQPLLTTSTATTLMQATNISGTDSCNAHTPFPSLLFYGVYLQLRSWCNPYNIWVIACSFLLETLWWCFTVFERIQVLHDTDYLSPTTRLLILPLLLSPFLFLPVTRTTLLFHKCSRAHGCVRDFLLVVPLAWDTLPPRNVMAWSPSLCTNFTI